MTTTGEQGTEARPPATNGNSEPRPIGAVLADFVRSLDPPAWVLAELDQERAR